jgi:tyrosine-protein phosphatase YwqE
MVKQNQPLLSFGDKLVLVEFSMAHPSFSLKNILFDMQMMGYQPVIAHPERYSYLKEYKRFYDELKDIGCLFQLNLLSLTNYYGKSPQDLAQYLIRKGYYDLIGSDLHHLRHLESMNNSSILPALRNLLDTGKIRNDQL